MFETNVFSILGLGFVLGLKHATDADHLIAVSTIVGERKGFWNSSIVGAMWGLGHTASLLIVGLIVIAFHFDIPNKIAMGMEFLVAIMLIVLGVRVLYKIRRGATLHVHLHDHQKHQHVHPHFHVPGEESLHNHIPSNSKRPFFIGIVHGLAGSAALMLLVLATISSRALALLYIALFGLGSVGGMFVMSTLIGLPFAFVSNHKGLKNILHVTAGVLSVGFGLFYAWQIGVSWLSG